MALTLTSTAFNDGAPIPTDYTCDGNARSPALCWSGAPEGTKSFALIVHDPDAPRGDFTHWIQFNIPGDIQEIPEGADTGGAQPAPGDPGTNDFGKLGYGGPCPPHGHGQHHYVFDLYALDLDQLTIGADAKRADVEDAMRQHILGEAHLTGVYARQEAGALRSEDRERIKKAA